MAWHLITEGDDQNSNYMEFLIDSEEDIQNPPTDLGYALSSLAHTPGFGHMYEANAQGQWIEIGASE